MRRLWYRIVKHRFNAKNPRSWWMRCHVQTSGVSLTREEPMNNVVRAAYHALAAALGGAQSLHVDGYDEAYSVPSEEASILAMRTQQIIEVETQVTQVVDPLGGSFYIEALTNQIEEKILNEVDEIERMGGIVEVVANGWLYKKVTEHIQREQKMIANGDIKVVGRNYFRAPDLKAPDVWVHEYDDNLGKAMRDKLVRLRQRRNNEKADNCLNALKEACRLGDNVMDYTLECARADCTEGEMRRALVDAFGLWKPPVLM